MPNNVRFIVNYQTMKRVTESFTRQATRVNSAKLTSVSLIDPYKCLKPVKDYFSQT